ncbi:MAG TPA: CHAT domain-containing protein [Candidatus Angelobacter sp.]|nr:CHAT domain-containing protein [Candidatus Angelobacter sp.]
MLEWEYDKAIRELDHALALKPGDPGLLLDEAIALAQRAEKTGSIDLGHALDNLSQVLQKNPENKVALFNRAIIFDKMQSPGPAITDLEHYLALDRLGPWADEARRRLTELRKKNKTHQQRMEEPLLEPRELLREVTLYAESTWTVVDARVEDYLDRATEDWLPAAFSSKNEMASRQEALRALRLLAMILQRKHADQWLADMLESPASNTWSYALSALRKAILDNRSGDLAGARESALRASKFFSAVGSKAGRARADAELVYVLHRLSDAKNCLRSATQLAAEIRGKRYAWLDSYLLLEQGVGFELTAQSQRTQQVLAAALRQTGNNGYGTLHLRAIGMEASFKMTEGDIVEGWSRDMRGLSQYQDGVFPPLRAYQFYADLAIAAETQGYWHLAYNLRKEAAEANALTRDHARGFIAYFAVAQAARIAGLDREADDALLKTSAELKLLPSDSTTQMYQTYNQLELAKLDGQIRQAASGLALLDQIEPRVKQSGSFPLLLDFYSTQGNLRLKLNQRQAAKNAFQLAVHAAGAELATLDDPRDRITWQKHTDDLYRNFIELQLDDGNTEEAFALLEWHRGAVFKNVQPRLPLAPEEQASLISLGNASQVGSVRPTVIVYAVFPQQFVIFLYNDGKITSKVLPIPSAELRRVVQQFYAQCSDRFSDMAELRKNSRQLYDWLIAPIQPYLRNNQSLMIEPDDILKQVPFRALLNSDQHYLSDSYLVHLIPGMVYLDHIRKPGVITRQTKALLVGVSASIAVQGHHLPALPSAEKEVRNLGAKFLHPRILPGMEAEIPAIERALPEAELFHFAGHALTTQDKVTLLVAPAIENEPGYLDSTRLRQLQLNRLQLVVLSGCSTGLGFDRRLPQLDRMVETLLEKGVPLVVASLWDVDTLATENTMESFYENMAGGKPVPDSLKESARLVRSDLQTAHPYYWAGFEIFGNSH